MSGARSATWPVLPSTSAVAPSGRTVVASSRARTAGSPSSRATIAAWESRPPVSVTTAATTPNNGVHAGSVVRHTSTSPDRTRPKSPGPRTTRTGPTAQPGLPGTPVRTVPVPSPAGSAAAVVPAGRGLVTGRAWRIQSREPVIAHSMSCGPPSRSAVPRPIRASRVTSSSVRQKRARSAGSTSRVITRAWSRSTRVLFVPSVRRVTVPPDTVQESGVTRPPTTLSPSPQDASTRTSAPVNITPATSASTRRCTSTAIAGASAAACRRRYSTARSDHSEAQHPRTASAT
nr:hypothetical protein [Streptomyces aurantiacus]